MSAYSKTDYAQIYSILSIMGDEYINKLPEKLVDAIDENRDHDLSYDIDLERPLADQDISKNTLSMIALFHLNYWSNEDEKKEIYSILDENEKRIEQEKQEKYGAHKLFKSVNETSEDISDSTELEIVEETSFIKKIIGIIKSWFKK